MHVVFGRTGRVKSMCTDPTQLPQHMCRTCVRKEGIGGLACMCGLAWSCSYVFAHALPHMLSSLECLGTLLCLGDGDEELGEGGSQSSQGGPGTAAARRMAQGVKVRVQDSLRCSMSCVTCRIVSHSSNAAHYI